MPKSPAKVLFLDIETAPAQGFFWGHVYETNVIKVNRPAFLLSYAWKWMGEKKIHFKSLRDYPLYKENLENDYYLLRDLRDLMDESNVIIAHNGDKFDIRVIQGRFIRYGIKPPSFFRTVDTLKVCQSQFKIESNRLNFVADYLGIGRKLPHTGLDLWERCMQGQDAAWDMMGRYNKHDIFLLEGVYDVIRPYIKNHPNLNLYTMPVPVDNEPVPPCPTCQSTHTKKRGIYTSNARHYQQYLCHSCGRNYHSNKCLKEKKKTMAPWRVVDDRPPCPKCSSLYVNRHTPEILRKGRFEQFKCQECGKHFRGKQIA